MPHRRKRLRTKTRKQRQHEGAKRDTHPTGDSIYFLAEDDHEDMIDLWETASNSPPDGSHILQDPIDLRYSRECQLERTRLAKRFSAGPPISSRRSVDVMRSSTCHSPEAPLGAPQISSASEPRTSIYRRPRTHKYIRHNGAIPIRETFWEAERAMLRLPRHWHREFPKDSVAPTLTSSEEMLERRNEALEWARKLEKELIEKVRRAMEASRRPTVREGQPPRSAQKPSAKKPPAAGPTTTSSLYRPLDTVSKQIRLLQLEPRREGEDVMCAFLYSEIQDCPSYTALSYAWGEAGVLRNLHIESCGDLSIRDNLYSYLHMRSSTIKQTTYFWIDAICIDQSNVQERNHQVYLMRNIYTVASTVDIWLGAEADESELAIRHINATAKRSPTTAGPRQKKVWSSRVGRAVSELCERPYWRRMWIIQEVCHADDINVWCGQKCFSWSNLEALYLRLKVLEDTSWFAHQQFVIRVLQSSACVMVWQRAHWRHQDTPTPSLQTLIEVFHSWHCTDLRDKVFALVGMADPKTTITPDYEKTTVHIYRDVVRRNNEEGTKWSNLLSQVLAIPEKDCNLGGRQLIEYKQHPAERLVLRKRIENEVEDRFDPRS